MRARATGREGELATDDREPRTHPAHRRGKRRGGKLALVVFFLLAVFANPAQAGAAILTTDKADYAPGEVVHISGSWFDPDTTYALPVKRPDGSIVLVDPVTHIATPGWGSATSDGAGYLTYDYQLDGIEGLYEARAYPADWAGDWSQAPIASVTFTDGTIPNSVSSVTWRTQPSGAWVQGTLQANNSDYKEGETVPFRLELGTLSAANNPYTARICRDYQLGNGTYGYTTLQPFSTSRAASPGGPITSSSGAFSGVNLTITTVTEVGGPSIPGFNCGSTQRLTTVEFNVSASGPQFLLWGGRLASPADAGVPEGKSASFWSGGSLQMRLLSPDKTSGIQPNAVIRLAKITVQKVVDSGTASPDQWCFNISPNPNGETLPKCPPTGSDTVTFFGLSTGSYQITETSVAGYAFASGSGTNCTFAGSTATSTVTASQNPNSVVNGSCVFHNALSTGTVVINKTAVGGNGTFSFTGTGTGIPSNFNIATSGGSGSQTFTNVPAGAKTVTESGAPSGWDATNLVCNDPDNGTTTSGQAANIDLDAGETVTCTYTNTKRGTVVINKTAVGGNGAFSYTGTGAGIPNGGFTITTSNGSGSLTFADIQPGAKTVTEGTPPAGWSFTSLVCNDPDGGTTTGGQTANIDLDPGETVTCTYTNTGRGTVVIKKTAVGGNDTFSYTTTGAGLSNFDITTSGGNGSQTFTNVTGGAKTVTESGPPSGWDFTSLACNDPDAGTTTSGQTANIDLDPGETITCTYTNTKRGTVVINKTAAGGDDTFSYTGGGSGISSSFAITTSGGSGSQTFADILPGAKTVTESGPPAGWSFTSLSCNDPDTGTTTSGQTANIDLDPGETVSCTYTNTKKPNIKVEKTASASPISAGDNASFSITVTNEGPSTANGVTLTDNLPSGVSWSVGGANAGACSINTVPNPDVLTCNFGNVPSGETRMITLTGTTDAADCGTLTNTAEVSADNETPNATGDNSSTAQIAVQCPNNLVVKTSPNPVISAGDTLSFDIVVSNNGQGAATGVTLTDTLPGALGWSVSGPDAAACTLTGNNLSCTFGTLAAGGSRSITVSRASTASDCPSVSNTATVSGSNEPSGSLGDNSSTATVTVNCPDLAITKSGNGPISAGDTASYTLTVTNNGAGNAYNVTVTDNLPAGVSWSENNPNCTISGQTLSCNFGTLAANGTATVTVSGQTDAADCGTLTNQASTAASNEHSSTGSNNSDSASITVNCPNNLVVKTSPNPVISAGDQIGFTIVVTNNGQGNATGVVLTDNLPGGINWQLGGADATACQIAGGTLTCNFGTLAPNASKTITLSGTTDAGDCGTVSNTATVSGSNEPQASLGDNSSTATVTVNCPDLSVTKSAAASPISAGDHASFTITVTNTGAGKAYDVTLTDTLPTGVTWTENNPNCTITSGVLSCNFGTLAPNASASVTVSGQTDANDCGTLTNTANAAAGNEHSSTTGNNSASASITVNCPDVRVDKSAADASISAGETASFTILVSNSGLGEAKNVTVTDPLPPGIAWQISPPVSGCSITAGTLSCSFATLASGASVSIIVSGETDANDCGTLNNTANTAAGNEHSSASGNNSDSASITVNCPNNLVVKSTPNATISAGDQIGFTIVVTNNGAGNATGVVLTDNLPGGVTWTLGGPDATACQITSGTLTCNFGTLAPNASKTITLSGTTDAADCGPVSNTATVSGTNEAAGQLGDNSSTATVTVNCPDLRVAKSGNGPISAGDTAAFTITVSNSGPGNAYNVTLADTLPSGVNWTANNPNCTITGQTLSCSFGTLASGASVSVVVSGQTAPTDCGTLTNSATASASNEASSASGNNTASASIEVRCPNNIVVKSTPNATISAGDQIGFTIVVTNNGAGTATGVVLNDNLPGGITWALGGSDANACQMTSGVLSCNFGTLAPNQSKTITLTGTTDADDCGTVSNTATVSGTNEPQGSLADNSSTATVTVNCPDVGVVKTAAASPISAGDTASFSIVVSNAGPGIARNVTVSDTLPAGITWADDSGDCTISSGVLSCSFGDLAAGASRTVTVSGATDANDCGTLTNTANTAAANEHSSATANNSDSAQIAVNCPNNLVVKSTPNATISAGDQIGFTIVVTNNGAGNATGVVLTDNLPGGITWTVGGANASACEIANGTLSCNFGTLAPNQSKTITLTGTTDADDCGTVSNTATVSGTNEPQASLGDNSSTATVTVNCPDLGVVKTAAVSPISAGDTASFSIVVSNAGPGIARNVTVTDALPVGITWSDDSAACTITNGTLNCNFGDLASGDSRTVTVSGTTDANDCGTLNNTANTAATNESSNATGNNSDGAQITVNCPNNLVVKSAEAPVISAGDTIAFTITVTNSGAGQATGVTLEDQLPAGISWTLGGANAGSCQINAGMLTCNFGTLAAGASRTITISGTTDPDDCGTITNTATASGTNEADNQLSDNTSTDTVRVDCPDISVDKKADSSPVPAGGTASFTITVTNAGPGKAYDVSLTDNLPAGVNWSESSADCSIAGGTLTCNFGTVAANTSKTVTVSGQTDAADCGTLTNTANAAASNEKTSAQGNNSDTASIAVQCGEIRIDKVTQPAGSPQSFAFTLKGGPSNLNQSFSLTDADPPHSSGQIAPGSGYNAAETVPAGWVLQSATCSDGSPVTNINVGANEVVTCTFRNVQKPRLTVAKACPNGKQSPGDLFEAIVKKNGSETRRVLDCGQSTTPPLVLDPGTYTVSEGVPAGNTTTNLQNYTITIACNGSGSTVTLAYGDNKTCTITNTRKGPRSQPFTPGYWKNHRSHTTSLLPVKLGNYLVSTFTKASNVFDAMNCGTSSSQTDAVGCLAGHLLAAKLNVKNGADNCINAVIAQADQLLIGIGYNGPGRYNLPTGTRDQMIAVKDKLDRYNNGGGCT